MESKTLIKVFASDDGPRVYAELRGLCDSEIKTAQSVLDKDSTTLDDFLVAKAKVGVARRLFGILQNLYSQARPNEVDNG